MESLPFSPVVDRECLSQFHEWCEVKRCRSAGLAPKAERRSSAAKLAFWSSNSIVVPPPVTAAHRPLLEHDQLSLIVAGISCSSLRTQSFLLAFRVAHSAVEMGKLTSTIGIPIKLLNEAQVCSCSTLGYCGSCFKRNGYNSCLLEKWAGSRAQTANFVFAGPRCDARDHIRCRLPGEAAGRCVDLLIPFEIPGAQLVYHGRLGLLSSLNSRQLNSANMSLSQQPKTT